MRWRRAGLSASRWSPAAKAAASPAGTTIPAPSPTSRGTQAQSVVSTGRPVAMPSIAAKQNDS